MIVGALMIALTPFVARPILDLTVRGLDAVRRCRGGSFFAALALFAILVTFGAVAPFAIRLALSDVGEAGTVAGSTVRPPRSEASWGRSFPPS